MKIGFTSLSRPNRVDPPAGFPESKASKNGKSSTALAISRLAKILSKKIKITSFFKATKGLEQQKSKTERTSKTHNQAKSSFSPSQKIEAMLTDTLQKEFNPSSLYSEWIKDDGEITGIRTFFTELGKAEFADSDGNPPMYIMSADYNWGNGELAVSVSAEARNKANSTISGYKMTAYAIEKMFNFAKNKVNNQFLGSSVPALFTQASIVPTTFHQLYPS